MVKIIGSLDRGLRILDMLEAASEPLGVTEIALALDVDKSTAYRLLSTMHARGYVEQLDSKKYRLGCRCIHLGSAALSGVDVRAEGAPFLEELARRTGKTVHLAILTDHEAIYVDRVQGRSVIAISTSVGSEAPMHCTASGKAMLATLSPEVVLKVYKGRKLDRYTPNTITDLSQLMRHLGLIREQGYALDDEERYEGVRCIAAPVLGHDGQAVASIGVSAASSQMDMGQVAEVKEVVLDVASRMSAKLGHVVTT